VAKEFLNPRGLSVPQSYTQVVTARGGKMIFVAGQVAFDTAGELVGPGDLKAQTKQVYENLKTALTAAGATFADVVKLTTYVVGYQPEHRLTINEVRNQYVLPNPPASTLVGVGALAREDLLIEVEAIAVVD
jgi:enamine deaminase RidA (YjgF/YER057c/UK114 family)